MGRPLLTDKNCSKCNIRKDKAEFYGKIKKSGICKQCQTIAQVERRKFVAEYLKEHPCVDCKESDIIVLDFDHIENKVVTISQMMRRNVNKEQLLAEIAKCEVRCSNCHRRKTAKQFGWIHKTS